jgi:hypothetical protein
MTCCDQKRPVCRWSLLLLVAGWFLLALFAGEIELLSILPGAAIPGIVLTLATGLLATFWIWTPFRRCVECLDLRMLILPHLARLVGIYFLYLHSKGHLPGQFAVPAGWGDIVAAVGALLLLSVPSALKNKNVLLVWNAAGLLDILFVVKTAASLVISNRDSMSVMTHLPLSLLPTMIVPLVIATHVIILVRVLKTRPLQPGSEGSIPATETQRRERRPALAPRNQSLTH